MIAVATIGVSITHLKPNQRENGWRKDYNWLTSLWPLPD